MLSAAPDEVSAEQIAAASRWTLLKSLGATVAMSLGAVLLVRALVARIKTRQPMDRIS
jgi:hypothetical protein